MTQKSSLCKKCQKSFDNLCDSLETQAKKMKRGGMIIDCLTDIVACVEAGNISPVIQRDKEWQQGKRNRRLQVRKK